MIPRTLVLLCALALGASPTFAHDLNTPWEHGPERADRIQALVSDASLGEAELLAALDSSDWRVRQQAAVVHGWRAYPELYGQFAELPAPPTRAGTLRFRGPELADARLAPLFLERLLEEPGAEMEHALIEVLPRTGGDWSEAFVGLLQLESQPDTRVNLIVGLRHAPEAAAVAGLRVGLADPDDVVRAAAASTAGFHDRGEALAAELCDALRDESAAVRAMAARSLGYQRVAVAFEPLLPLLRDADAKARLEGLRALQRIDAAGLAVRPEMDALVHDPDPKVARAAQTVR